MILDARIADRMPTQEVLRPVGESSATWKCDGPALSAPARRAFLVQVDYFRVARDPGVRAESHSSRRLKACGHRTCPTMFIVEQVRLAHCPIRRIPCDQSRVAQDRVLLRCDRR